MTIVWPIIQLTIWLTILTDWLTDHWTDNMTVWFIDCSTNCLTDWLFSQSNSQLIKNWLVSGTLICDWLYFDYLAAYLTDCITDTDYLIISSSSWLSDWLDMEFSDWQFNCMSIWLIFPSQYEIIDINKRIS